MYAIDAYTTAVFEKTIQGTGQFHPYDWAGTLTYVAATDRVIKGRVIRNERSACR